ncbi:MAG: Ig-like domain-containing protein [Thermoplasmatota archaeon]
MSKKIITIVAIIIIVSVILSLFFGYIKIEDNTANQKPIVSIDYPYDNSIVSKIVIISGSASDPDGNDTLVKVEILINNQWVECNGTTKWIYTWDVYKIKDGVYTINARSWDGIDYSDYDEIKIKIENPETKEYESHKWAVFISASNFPKDNESKLGNGALNLAEEMALFFIEKMSYSTKNIFILFDDGWVRKDNGFGEPLMTLQERKHKYNITYAGAVKKIFESTIDYVINEANNFDDSEVFIWMAGHGSGNLNNTLTGGKILEKSEIFLWDDTISDIEFGNLLSSLKSRRVCIVIDACFSGGFADKTIFGFREFFLLKSKLPRPGRVVITATSKFRPGYTSVKSGPLFSQLWFYGLSSGEADGFKRGILHRGRPTILKFFKDGKVSVEEAFYYACFKLRTDKALDDYSKMEPQINDQYPNRGIRNIKGLVLSK